MSSLILTSYARSLSVNYINELLSETMSTLIANLTIETNNLKSKSASSSAVNNQIDSKVIISNTKIVLDKIITSRSLISNLLKNLCNYLKLSVNEFMVHSSKIDNVSTSPSNNQKRGDSNSISSVREVPGDVDSIRTLKTDSISPNVHQAPIRSITEDDDSKGPLNRQTYSQPILNYSGIDPSSQPLFAPGNTKGAIQRLKEEAVEARIHSTPELASNKSNEVSPQVSRVASSFNLNEEHFFDLGDRVVGTFLFLRLFIPGYFKIILLLMFVAITSPKLYNLVSTTLDPAIVKCLIRIGKVLNAFFSDSDYKTKNTETKGVFEFVEEHKENLRDFLRFITIASESVI